MERLDPVTRRVLLSPDEEEPMNQWMLSVHGSVSTRNRIGTDTGQEIMWRGVEVGHRARNPTNTNKADTWIDIDVYQEWQRAAMDEAEAEQTPEEVLVAHIKLAREILTKHQMDLSVEKGHSGDAPIACLGMLMEQLQIYFEQVEVVDTSR